MENRINLFENDSGVKSTCRRIHHRLEAFLPIRLETKDASPNLALNLTGQITDISEGGLGVILKEKLPVPANLKLFVDSTAHYPRFQTEAVTLWKNTDLSANNGLIRYGLRFSEAEDKDMLRNFLNKLNLHHVENFFGFALPCRLRETCKDNYISEKFDQKQIMKVIDFIPPFLRIEKMAIFCFGRENILQNQSIATGILTIEDVKGHYNDTIFLAMYGLLMASSASIHLAALFPSTAPQVVEVARIKPSRDRILWRPVAGGSRFIVETRIIKKKLQMVIAHTRLFSEGVFMGEVSRLKLILAPKEHIWKAKKIPDSAPRLKETNPGNSGGFLQKTSIEESEDFFAGALPEEIKQSYISKRIYKKLNKQDIAKIIDFTAPFLKINRMVIFNADKDSMLQSSSLAVGTITPKDMAGHYNDTIFLAKCGWLMSSAASVHLAALFPGTAPDVIEAKGVKPIEKEVWKPADNGSTFWLEISIIKKKFSVVIVKAKIYFGNMPYGMVEELKLLLIPRQLIWQAPELVNKGSR